MISVTIRNPTRMQPEASSICTFEPCLSPLSFSFSLSHSRRGASRALSPLHPLTNLIHPPASSDKAALPIKIGELGERI